MAGIFLILADIVESFSISNISKSPAIFDIDKLSWINGNHIREKSAEDIFKLVMPFMKNSLIVNDTGAAAILSASQMVIRRQSILLGPAMKPETLQERTMRLKTLQYLVTVKMIWPG